MIHIAEFSQTVEIDHDFISDKKLALQIINKIDKYLSQMYKDEFETTCSVEVKFLNTVTTYDNAAEFENNLVYSGKFDYLKIGFYVRDQHSRQLIFTVHASDWLTSKSFRVSCNSVSIKAIEQFHDHVTLNLFPKEETQPQIIETHIYKTQEEIEAEKINAKKESRFNFKQNIISACCGAVASGIIALILHFITG